MTIVKALKDYIIGLQHIGYIVTDLDAAIDAFTRLYGLDAAAIMRIPDSADEAAPVWFAFITVGDTEFELIQPVSDDSRRDLLASPAGGGGINHVAWRVSDIDACVASLAAKGIKPGHVTPDGVVDTGRSKIVYFDASNTGGILIELVERVD